MTISIPNGIFYISRNHNDNIYLWITTIPYFRTPLFHTSHDDSTPGISLGHDVTFGWHFDPSIGSGDMGCQGMIKEPDGFSLATKHYF